MFFRFHEACNYHFTKSYGFFFSLAIPIFCMIGNFFFKNKIALFLIDELPPHSHRVIWIIPWIVDSSTEHRRYTTV